MARSSSVAKSAGLGRPEVHQPVDVAQASPLFDELGAGFRLAQVAFDQVDAAAPALVERLGKLLGARAVLPIAHDHLSAFARQQRHGSRSQAPSAPRGEDYLAGQGSGREVVVEALIARGEGRQVLIPESRGHEYSNGRLERQNPQAVAESVGLRASPYDSRRKRA
jgi:hypothetical protein